MFIQQICKRTRLLFFVLSLPFPYSFLVLSFLARSLLALSFLALSLLVPYVIQTAVLTEINLSLQNKRIWYKYSVNLITFVVERKRLTLRQVNKGNNRTTSPVSAYDLSE